MADLFSLAATQEAQGRRAQVAGGHDPAFDRTVHDFLDRHRHLEFDGFDHEITTMQFSTALIWIAGVLAGIIGIQIPQLKILLGYIPAGAPAGTAGAGGSIGAVAAQGVDAAVLDPPRGADRR